MPLHQTANTQGAWQGGEPHPLTRGLGHPDPIDPQFHRFVRQHQADGMFLTIGEHLGGVQVVWLAARHEQ